MIIGGVNFYVMFIGFDYISFILVRSLKFRFIWAFGRHAGSHVLTSTLCRALL